MNDKPKSKTTQNMTEGIVDVADVATDVVTGSRAPIASTTNAITDGEGIGENIGENIGEVLCDVFGGLFELLD